MSPVEAYAPLFDEEPCIGFSGPFCFSLFSRCNKEFWRLTEESTEQYTQNNIMSCGDAQLDGVTEAE